MRKSQKKVLVLLLITVMSTITYAQTVTVPNVSQKSIITQRLGLSDVTITYHSPSIKGRKIFGGLVPYGNIWRAGANENTTIYFTDDAFIEGKKIAAGTYGLYMAPSEDKVEILFSKYNKSWGTVAPAEQDLALKINVKPETIPFQEWLSYDFIDRGSNSLTATLQWEKTRIPFKIEFDVVSVVIENFRHELKGLAGFGWQGHMQAARYCLQNDTNLEEAMVWIEKSLASASGFSNLMVKAGLLAKQGKIDEAEKIRQEAIPTGSPNQLNNYGYQLLAQNKTKEAIKVFEYNVEQNQDDPFVWGFTDSLGEAYLKDGDKKNALKYYKEAKSKAPQNQQAYFDGVISGIK
jgi:tetratricopeptide (TPR) repeat protein